MSLLRLCESRWQKVSAYKTDYCVQHSYKQLYMTLDNGTLTFSADPHEVCMHDDPVVIGH